MDYLSVIEMLNACHGPSGDERQIAATLKRLAEPYADECWGRYSRKSDRPQKGKRP